MELIPSWVFEIRVDVYEILFFHGFICFFALVYWVFDEVFIVESFISELS